MRWLGDDHVSLFFPEQDTRVVTAEEQARQDADERDRLSRTRQAIQHT